MRSPDIEMAVRLYYEKPEITNADIKALFSTGETQTIKIKKAVKEEMENHLISPNEQEVSTLGQYRDSLRGVGH
jgi:hypothetical protein